MFLPSVRAQNIFDLLQGKIAFLFAVVEVRRDAHACVRAVVHQDFASEQFTADLVGVRTVDGNGAAAFRGVFRGVDAPAPGFCAGDESRGHADGFRADGGDTGFVDDVQTRLACVESGNVGRAVEIAERIFSR